ncbi:ankyrin repeat-containing domain protein [Lasiosphaeria ovina]|uniref:Ankyrin repeat-containing domain protein n=1 Tax=Lasiosphaeria ovina TaxID=92902 RepID=A0AAE0KC91_9PEZI|nr:ankyrin repeat-containing domain protein [Lasiosphaeria ovina]
MTIDSDIKFKLVIVNHDSPPPSLKSQNLKIAVGDINRQANTEKETSPPDNDAETDTKIAVGDIDRQASTEEETPSPDLDTKIDAKADNKEVFDEEHILLQPLARDLDTLDNMSKSLELVLELPRLYPLKSSLAKLFTESEAEGLGEALCVWVRDKGINTPIDSLEQEITQLSPISPKKLFKQIILPTLALPRTKEWAIPTLELLLHAFRPLTIYEVEDLVTTQPSNQLQKDESSQALRYGASMAGLHGLIVVQHSEIHFGHPAFREFLLAGEGGQKLQASSGLHARITAACLEYLLSAVDNGLLTDYQEDDPMPESRLDFSSYAVNYWPRHLKLAGSDLSPDSPPIKKLIEHETALDVWAKAYWNRSNPTTRSPASCISSAAIAAEHGLESLLERILKKRKQISSFEEECFHALEAAARNGHGSLVRNLLTVPLPEDRRLEAVALATLDGRHVEIFRQIIQKLDVDATSPKALSEIFQKAALLGLVDEMKLLIPLMPADTDWDPILYTACMGGSLKSVKLVLESRSASPEPKVAEDPKAPASALEVACIYGHVEISAFLAEKKIISARAINKDEPEPSDKEWFDMFAKVIHIAEQSGQSEVLRSLLAVASKWDYTSYSFALERCLPCLTQHHVVRCCKVVFDQFAKFLTPEEVSEKAKPQLKNAVERGDPDMLRELLSRIHGTIDKETRDELWKAAKDKGDLALDVFSLLADEGSKVWDKEELSDVLGATLCAAAKSNSPKLVDFLIERGAELNKQDELGRTPLFQAAWHGNNGIVKRLIEAKADLESTAPCDDNGCCGWTPLFASYDQAATLEILLEAGSNVNVKSEHGTTVLWLSGTRGHMDAVKALIKGKPEVATLDTLLNKKTPLSDAAARENPEIVRLLLDAGSNPSAFPAEDLEAPLLHECVKNSNLEILRMFLEYPLPLDQRDGDGNTPLTSITADTSVPVVRLLVNRGASLELTNSGDLTPLGKAITVGNIDVAKYLISVGANVQASVGRSGTILHVACSTGEGGLPAVKLLIDSGADVNNADPGPNGTPFQAACRRAETDTLSDTAEIINYLVDDVKIQVRQQSNWWGSNLSVACLVADLDIVDKLIERGADVEAEDRMGRQPIHFALFRTVTYVERLRSQGADLFDTDLMGRGPLHIAVLSGRLELVQYVLAQKEGLATEKDVDNWTPLLWAVCFVGNWKTETSERGAIVSELLKHGASRLTEGEGLDRTWTALKLARYYGLPEEIIDLVTPTEDELQSLGKDEGPWRYSIRNDTRQAKVYPGSFCDACLMVSPRTKQGVEVVRIDALLITSFLLLIRCWLVCTTCATNAPGSAFASNATGPRTPSTLSTISTTREKATSMWRTRRTIPWLPLRGLPRTQAETKTRRRALNTPKQTPWRH